MASFNIRTSRGQDGWNSWLLRRRACVAAVEALGADLIALQEVRPNALRYLQRAFRGRPMVGGGRDADGGGEHVPVLVLDPRLTV
ncbi:MAG: Endonuclease/exonuclease/phosphatase, partial [Solirubrobacteraceae bacterium]|nr:Endonuclease/exonuclease/phosphatase [Solirubrobacteraceae bacterium]